MTTATSDRPSAAPRRVCRRIELALALLAALAGLYIYQGAGWNQRSRDNVIFAFVEPGTPDSGSFRMDRFMTSDHDNTGDWSNNPAHDDHFYSNKAPGPMLAGIVAYAPLYLAEALVLGRQPVGPIATHLNAWLLNLLLTVLPLGLAVPLFYRFLCRQTGGNVGQAAVLTLGLVGGTLILPYSTQLWGHVTAAACVMVCVSCLDRRERWAVAACGLWGGLAVLCEYSCAITVVLVAGYLLAARRWRELPWYALGGLLPLLVYGLYHWLCFGHALTTANFYNNPYFRLGNGEYGIFAPPSWGVLYGLTFSPYRGLFLHMPWLLLLLPAVAMLRASSRQLLAWFGLANLLGFLVFNLCFNGWHGGACIGPRYLIPALPCAVLPLVLVPWRRPWPQLAVALLAISMLNMWVITGVGPLAPVTASFPLRTEYRMLSHGTVHSYGGEPQRLGHEPETVTRRYGAFNLGEWLGLRGTPSLLPWIVLQLVLLIFVWRQVQSWCALVDKPLSDSIVT